MSTMTSTMAPAAPPQSDARAGKYLTFQLGNEEFGIRVLKVREIMGIQEITAVPQTPAHIKGADSMSDNSSGTRASPDAWATMYSA